MVTCACGKKLKTWADVVGKIAPWGKLLVVSCADCGSTRHVKAKNGELVPASRRELTREFRQAEND